MSIPIFIKDISDFIFLSDPPQASDVLFIPGGTNTELPEHAAKLYAEGYAPYILPSGRYSVKRGAFPGPKTKKELYPGPYPTEFAFMADVLKRSGVPETAILKEDEAQFTQQNAVFSREACDRQGLKVSKAIIVCKAFHARRCFAYYSMAFPQAQLLVCPVQTGGVTKDDWFLTEKGVDRVLGELARCGSQMTDDIKRSLFH